MQFAVPGERIFCAVSRESRRFWAIVALCGAGYAAITHGRVFSAGNDASRWAQIEAVVDLGTTSIEGSRFGATVDRVRVDGREFSNKPPFFSLVGAALYAPLARLTGWRLGDPRHAGAMIRLLTWLLVGLPAALTVALFDRTLARAARLGGRSRTVLTVALAAGTLVTSFAGTLNNHVPAAALLLAGFVATLEGEALGAGAACGFAAAVDLLPGFGLAPFLAAILWRDFPDRARALRRFALGLGSGVLAMAAADLYVTGTLLPPKFLPGAVDLAAQFGASAAGVVLPESPLYGLEILFGWHGLFLVSPVLVVGAWGLARASSRPPFGTAFAWRALAAALVAQAVGHALVAGSYGGWSYGFRYLLPIQPLLLLAAPAALEALPARRVLAALLPVSVLFALLGAYHPWPPAFEQEQTRDPVASLVRDPIGGNATGLVCELAPASGLCAGLGRVFVSADPQARRRYLVYFFGSKGDLETMREFQR